MQSTMTAFMSVGECPSSSNGSPSGPGLRHLGSCPCRKSKSAVVMAPLRVSRASRGIRGMSFVSNGSRE